MPSPVFIVCSEGGSIDRHTNMLSIFDVIERLSFKVMEKPSLATEARLNSPEFAAKPAMFHSLRMTAVWRQDEGDDGQEFEFKTVIEIPGVAEPIIAGEGAFVFKTALHRLLATFHHDLPPQSGQLVVTNSVRKTGSQDWLRQQYVIPVERMESEPT